MDQASVDAEGILLSALADITMLADAAAIVGGISTFTNLAQRLGAARSGIPMPWIDVGSRHVREWVQQRWEAENEGSWLESTAETLAAAWSGEPEAAEKAAMSATGGEEAGGGDDECPTEAELTAHLDLDGDGEVSDCERRFLYKPLAQMPLERNRLPTMRDIMPGCARIYKCLATSPPMPQANQDLPHTREVIEMKATSQMCHAGDLGPFPCFEEGCERYTGIVMDCPRLKEGGACSDLFSQVWKQPQSWAARLRVWEACPHSCGLCDEEVRRLQEAAMARRRGGGSCDA